MGKGTARFIHLKQQASKVIAPTEAARVRRDALHADDWQTTAIGFQHGKQFHGKEVLGPIGKGGMDI